MTAWGALLPREDDAACTIAVRKLLSVEGQKQDEAFFNASGRRRLGGAFACVGAVKDDCCVGTSDVEAQFANSHSESVTIHGPIWSGAAAVRASGCSGVKRGSRRSTSEA